MDYSLTPAQARAFHRLREMMEAYFVRRDAEQMLSYYTEDVHSIGTGVQETAFSRDELRRLVKEEIIRDPGPFSFSIEKVRATGGNDGTVCLYTVLKVGKLLSADIPLCVEMRQTALLQEQNGLFYIRAVHVSVPASQQKEDEYYPIQFGEQTLRERQANLDSSLFNLLNETMPGGFMGGYVEHGFPLYFISNRMLKYLGHTYESYVEATGGLILNGIHPHDQDRVEREIFRSFEKTDTYTVTYRMLKKDDSLLWIYDQGRRILTEDGREAIISACFDVTAQAEAESALSFIAQSKIGGLFKARMDQGFTVLYANDCYYQLHGYTRQQFFQQFQNQASHLVHPDDLSMVSRKIADAIQKKQESLVLEYRILRGDGKIAWLQANAALTEASDGTMLSGMVINIDERKHFEEQLQWSEKRFQIAIQHTTIHVWDYDLQTRSILQTEKSHLFFGMDKVIPNVPESLIDSGCIHPDDTVKYAAMYSALHTGVKTTGAQVRIMGQDGKYHWEKIRYTNVFNEAGIPIRAVAVSEDITDQKEAEQRYFQEEHLREMLSADVLASFKINLSQNKVLRIWRGRLPHDFLRDIISYDQLFGEALRYIAHKGDQKRFSGLFSPSALSQAASQGQQSLYGEYRCSDGNGHILWCGFHVTLFCDSDTSERYVFCHIRDINERKKTELALRERAERDSLTGLYNRQTVESIIEKRLAFHQDRGLLCALFIIDVDNFKQINDTYGHYLGDQLLQEIGRILRIETNGSSIAGRFGGDEFLLFYEEIPNRYWAEQTADRLCKKLKIRYAINGKTLKSSVSVGMVIAECGKSNFQHLFQKADAALYDAKLRGKSQYTHFDSDCEPVQEIRMVYEGCIAKQHLGERCMLDELDDSLFIIDDNSHDVLFMNSVAQKEFGIESYRGKKCYDILQGFTQPCVFCKSHLPEESGYQTWETTNARLRKRYMIRDKSIHWDGKRARLEVFTDLTKHPRRLNTKLQAQQLLLERSPRNSRMRCLRLDKLRSALDNHHFQVYLQPKFEIPTGRVCGAEALARYVDDRHGVVSPVKFIPQLEKENNVRYVDFFMLEEVCRLLRSWQKQSQPVLPISLNFSRCTLMEDGVVEEINRIVDQYELERSLLEIEVTESVDAMDRRILTDISQRLIQAGYRLFLDDFGAEYSNLSILSALPLSGLKLDRSLIHDLYANPTSRVVAESLIQLCHKMKIVSIAEGVEDEEQLEILRAFGCTYAQGYLFNKPIPVQDYEKKYLNTAL